GSRLLPEFDPAAPHDRLIAPPHDRKEMPAGVPGITLELLLEERLGTSGVDREPAVEPRGCVMLVVLHHGAEVDGRTRQVDGLHSALSSTPSLSSRSMLIGYSAQRTRSEPMPPLEPVLLLMALQIHPTARTLAAALQPAGALGVAFDRREDRHAEGDCQESDHSHRQQVLPKFGRGPAVEHGRAH